MTSSRRGFTLIELLIVLSILVLLTGLLMPLLTISQREAKRSATRATMAKVESALHQFKSDFKAYPYQLSCQGEGSPAANRLAYTLGTAMVPADRALVQADMAAAAADYQYDCSSPSGSWSEHLPPVSPHVFVSNRQNGNLAGDQAGSPEGDAAPVGSLFQTGNQTWYWTYQNMVYTCVVLNRLAAERANLLMLIGDVTAGGCVMQDIIGPGNLLHHGRDCSGIPLVGSPGSLEHPGWAVDYLHGELPAGSISGEQVLDAYHRPLIYICQVQPGVEPTIAEIYNSGVNIDFPQQYGLAPIGRKELVPLDPVTQLPLPADPQTLPDPSNLLHSDMRAWAPPHLGLEFELWSAGPDGAFSWWRDDVQNRDNIPCENYNQSIGSPP